MRTEYITFQNFYPRTWLATEHYTKVKYNPKVTQTTEYFLRNCCCLFSNNT